MDGQDQKQLRKELERVLAGRREVVQILKDLEEAWRQATQECGSINKRVTKPQNTTQREWNLGQKKRRATQALQQQAFLLFEELTENKHENQIPQGEHLLKDLSKPNGVEAHVVEAFFKKEDNINKSFLERLNRTRTKIGDLLETQRQVAGLPCPPQSLERQLATELNAMHEFILTTRSLLGEPTTP
jgi:hypothetical protein